MTMNRRLFMTGMPRSGTTLLDKLLSLHPRAFVFSQPLPLLYVRAKEIFSRKSGQAFPLGDLFGDDFEDPTAFETFLKTFRLSPGWCQKVLHEMITYDGQYTRSKDPFGALTGWREDPFEGFVDRYLTVLLGEGTDQKDQPLVLGSKETFCEEFIPYLLGRGVQVLMILRDPRDVLTSLNHGCGRQFAGPLKPDLWNLRQWRKSVAFALAHQGNSGFLAFRFEDLVRTPEVVMSRITDWLGLSPLAPEVVHGDIHLPTGEIWTSNSSHHPTTRLTTQAIGRYREHLSREKDLFTQAICRSEMETLGYGDFLSENAALSILHDYREADPLERPELGDRQWSPARLAEEVKRSRALRTGAFEKPLFVFERAFDALRRRDPGGIV